MSPLDDQDRQRQQDFLRQWRRDQQRRRQRRNRWLGVAAAAVVALGVAAVAYAWMTDDGPPEEVQAAAPVRVELPADTPPAESTPATETADDPGVGVEDEVPAGARQEGPDEQGDIPLPPNAPVRTDQAAPAKGGSGSGSGSAATAAAGSSGAGAGSGSGSGGKPVVWVQAGHADPREPGYRDQTGASSGPFGGEIAFTTTLAPKLVARLRQAGVDARQTPGEVTPWGAEGAVFISLHSDIPQGRMAIGHAISGAGENYYHGEGGGTASPTPYSDSAPHRQATTVSGAVESGSAALASALSSTLAPIYTAANGAHAGFGGIQTRDGNPRMMRYYGFYRTRADARVLVELGAGGTDDAFLAKTDLIATALSAGVVKHLRAQGALG